jgi:putative alpha-1,2-mannosidase
MLGEPWKTADKVREVTGTLYSAAPDGLAGNEDVGQMSAWYILSAMGFYQAEPGSGRYWFGSPLVDEAEITVEKGIFRVVVENNSDKNRYIQSVSLDGKAWDKGYIEHMDIANGGTLTLKMGPQKTLWY